MSVPARSKAVWYPRRRLLPLVATLTIGLLLPSFALAAGWSWKLDSELARRSQRNPRQVTGVIVTLVPGATLPPEFKRFARVRGRLGIINGQVLDLPNNVLRQLEARPEIFRIHYDRPTSAHSFRAAITSGARAVQQGLGFTGAGVGVAVIDSGITTWHNDLANRTPVLGPYGDQRVAAFVDFVNGGTAPYDDEGHGTHVAGIIAGNGHDSLGRHAGMAPDATLVALKVLDAEGRGTISNAIAALDWVLAHRQQYNIRVVNLSVGAAVRESYWTDPLTLAAKRVADAGVVVVTAAGNFGENAIGEPLYGGVTAPGNAPWVLTIGASSTNGSLTRGDDAMAGFSSRGPTYLDWAAKPDLVASGVGIVSLSAPQSRFFVTKAPMLIDGYAGGSQQAYLTLSGTSMAAPVVAGTVALMLQANPSLTPNAVKAILHYTAEQRPGSNVLTQGAGFLNSIGAVRLAQFFATAQPGVPYPLQSTWSKKIIWGSHRLSGGVIDASANAFALGTTWGVARTSTGENIIWGTTCDAGCDNIIWGTSGSDHVIWGAGGDDNIIWGTDASGDNIIWGTQVPDENIIWGTDCGGADCDNIIWGTEGDGDNIIWGTTGGEDNIIWGTEGDDNIIWGTAGDDPDNIIWGNDDPDNIIWGNDDPDNIIWGNDDPDNIISGSGDVNVSGPTATSYPGLLWDHYYSFYSHYLLWLTDAQLFHLVDALTAVVNPWRASPPTGSIPKLEGL
jgi:serine protease AprX